MSKAIAIQANAIQMNYSSSAANQCPVAHMLPHGAHQPHLTGEHHHAHQKRMFTTSKAGHHAAAVPEGVSKTGIPPPLPLGRFSSAANATSTPSQQTVASPNVSSSKVAHAPSRDSSFNYEEFYRHELEKKHQDKSYRYFNNINRLAQYYPRAHTGTGKHVTVWCSNDYLGMSKHPEVIETMK